jgi:hypothetical protein
MMKITLLLSLLFGGFTGLDLVLASKQVTGVEHTFYGFPDNSPPGPGTAYDCGGRNFVAGGQLDACRPVTM